MSEFEKEKSKSLPDDEDYRISNDDELETDEMLGYSELDEELQNLDAEMGGDFSDIDSELNDIDNEFVEIGGDDSEFDEASASDAKAHDSRGDGESDALSSPYFAYIKPAFIAGLIIYCVYLVFAKAPAALAAWAVHQAVPELWFTSVEGSLWNGRAGSAQLDIGDQALALGQVEWSLDPMSILMLKPCVQFASELPGQSIAGRACQSPFGITSVSDIVVEAPISAFNQFLPVDASGQLSLNVLSAHTRGSVVSQLDARFSWTSARVSAEGNVFTLGAFGGELQADEAGGIRANVFDIEGPFSLKGNAAWNSADNIVKIDSTVIPKPGAPDMIVQALQVIGEDVGGGAYRIVWP